MNIKYYKEVFKSSFVLSSMNFNFLNKDIQEFIRKKDVEQEHYSVLSRKDVLYIYLDNGDRIDVRL